ncbi:MAG: hypothetical protein M5U26_17605 [Planctomycetota bacterium]|nr:hypothetical protein [Planctomycetota bacterium]
MRFQPINTYSRKELLRNAAVAGAVLAWAVSGSVQAEARPASMFRFHPLGVMDPQGRMGFVLAKEGLTAFDWTNGRVVWTAPEKSFPLMADETRIYAYLCDDKPGMRIVAYEFDGGGQRAMASEKVGRPNLKEREGFSFIWDAHIANQTLSLDYTERTSYVGGAAPPPDMPLSQDALGTLAVDLKTGRCNVNSRTAQATDPALKVPQELEGVQALPCPGVGRLDSAEIYYGTRAPIVLPKDKGGLVFRRKAGDGRVLFARWDTNTLRLESEVSLMEGQKGAVEGVALCSRDGAHLVLRVRHEGPQHPQYEYVLVSTATGKILADLERNATYSFVPGYLVVQRFSDTYTKAPGGGNRQTSLSLKLEVVDLKTGRSIWKQDFEMEPIPYYPPRP